MTKHTIKTIVLLTIVVTLFLIISYCEPRYQRTDCTVVAIEENNLVVVEDTCGYTWTYYADNEVPTVGNTITLKMHTNHTTDYIDDDLILEIVAQR
jgi:hypothetical protein